MNRRRLAALACLGMIASTASGQSSDPAAAAFTPGLVTATIQPEAQVDHVRPICLNLGQQTYWGAEQLSRNILMNPGFEGVVDRTLVRVTHPDRTSFSDDQRWLGRDDGFWSNAAYEVMTGTAAGTGGHLIDSRKRGRHDLPEYFPRSRPAALTEGDIVALTRIRDDLPPSHWWYSGPETGRFVPDHEQIRPGSPGARALWLRPFPGQPMWLASHMDTIGDRAGKLRPVNGPWRLSLWIHADAGSEATLRIMFRRHGSPVFIELEHRPEAGWHRLERRFVAEDTGPAGALELRLEVSGGDLRIDDIWLGPDEADPGMDPDEAPASHLSFAPEVIALLERLRPAYLRDWQGQLGDTLDNRLAAPHARRSSRYRPGDPFFLYGLDEFIALNRHIGSMPWLVMPTTLTLDEARRLGAWLAARIDADDLDEVLVEFGNENWNGVFRPGGIQDPRHHGFAADRLISALREGAGNHPALLAVINAQHANPDSALAFDRHSREADLVAVAPYLLHRLNAPDQGLALDRLFEDDGGRLNRIAQGLSADRQLAVYEVNLHATRGDSSVAMRNALITSGAAGAALAKRLLEGMAAGATRQCIYRLTGFDTRASDSDGLVRLFGISRNLHDADNLRPTGWAMAMLNQAVQPRLHGAELLGAHRGDFTVSAFAGERGWSAAIVSASPLARTVRLHFPDDGRSLPTAARSLSGLPGHFDGREASIAPQEAQWHTGGSRAIDIAVPAYGLVTLLP